MSRRHRHRGRRARDRRPLRPVRRAPARRPRPGRGPARRSCPPRCRCTAPACTVAGARAESTVPSNRAVSCSTIATWPHAAAAQVHRVGRVRSLRPEPAARPPPQHPPLHQVVEQRPRTGPAEQGEIVGGQVPLGGGARQVRTEHVRVGRVGDGGLHGPAEDRLRMVHEVGVQRVVAGDEDHQRPRGPLRRRARPAPPAATPRRACRGSRPARRRPARRCPRPVRARWSTPPPAARRSPARAPAPGAPPAGSRRGRPATCRPSSGCRFGQPSLGGQRRRLRAVPGPDEGQGAGARRDQVGHHPGRLGRRRPPHRRPVLALGVRNRAGSHSTKSAPGRGAPSSVTARTGRPINRSAADRRVGDGRGRQHEHRIRPVHPGQPDQPAQHQRDVRPEDPAVGVALVDDDVPQPAQQSRPASVPGQQPAVQHVRVRQHPVTRARAPSPAPHRRCRRRTAPPASQAAPVTPARPAGPPRAPWSARQVQRRGARLGEQRGQHGELVGQRLARMRCRWRARRPGRRAPARPPATWWDHGAVDARCRERCAARPAPTAARHAPARRAGSRSTWGISETPPE